MIPGADIFSLEGRTVLLTGAAGYLGSVMAAGLTSAGANVILIGRSEESLQRLADRLLEEGRSVSVKPLDVTDTKAVSAFCAEYGDVEIDVIVNAAYAGGSATLSSSTAADYRNAYEVTVVAASSLVNGLLGSLRKSVVKRGSASVINIASMYGIVSPDLSIYRSPSQTNPPFYGAAKAAMIQWTRYAANALGAEGIRVNVVSPGPFPSADVQDSEFLASLAQRVPLGRIGQADELIGPVIFLASDASSFVNGANLVVDGGWTIR